MKFAYIIGILLFLIIVSGCVQQPVCGPGQEPIVTCVNVSDTGSTIITLENETTVVTVDTTTTQRVVDTTMEDTMDKTTTTVTTTTMPGKVDAEKEYSEGDLISFKNLQASDPDGDPIEFTFNAPLDEVGEWQTKKGDAGEYITKIVASDGKSSTTKVIKLIVKATNNPPIIDFPDEIEVNAGDTIKLEPIVSDPDGDKVTIQYVGFMSTDAYDTTKDDVGEHKVTIIASDGKADVTKSVNIKVLKVNTPPEFSNIVKAFSVNEGELAKIDVDAFDADGDDVVVTFEKPFNKDGEWQTSKGDAGSYIVTVLATDGEAYATQKVEVTVVKSNSPPVIEINDTFTIVEGDTITLAPIVSDPDGDDVTVSYSGWMTSDTYTTGFDDQGEHNVEIIATDGVGSSKKMVKVIVKDVNRPPEFTI